MSNPALRAISKAARNHVYAAGAGLLFGATTVKLFWFSDASFVSAAAGIYGNMSFAIAGFLAVALGIQKFGPQPGPAPFGGRQREGHNGSP
jgi:hypothetical protein